MSTAAIVKACVILMGIGIMIVTFVLHAKKKLTVNLAVTWELLGIAAILSGAVPRFSGWSSRIGLGSLVVLLITALLVLWGVYQMTIQISSLLMKNQELAILVSLLNQENERETGRYLGKPKSDKSR